jgi:outer membrane PBP1 activator LpoA protein
MTPEALRAAQREAAIAAAVERFDALPDSALVDQQVAAVLLGRSAKTVANWRLSRHRPPHLDYVQTGRAWKLRAQSLRKLLANGWSNED